MKSWSLPSRHSTLCFPKTGTPAINQTRQGAGVLRVVHSRCTPSHSSCFSVLFVVHICVVSLFWLMKSTASVPRQEEGLITRFKVWTRRHQRRCSSHRKGKYGRPIKRFLQQLTLTAYSVVSKSEGES